LISCSPRVLARRPFYVIGQRRNPGHLLKRNGQTKWLERWHNKHRLFILWDQGTFHPFTHRRHIILFKYGMVQWWIHGTCIVPLSIQTGGHLHFISFDPLIEWSWLRKIQSKTTFIQWCFIEWSPYWKAGDLHYAKFICFWFVNLHQKAGAYVENQIERMVRPRGRTIHAGSEDGPRVRRDS
jgi:hypothetical protein